MAFLQRLAQESVSHRHQVTWFTSLVGKKTTFNFMQTYLREMLEGPELLIATHEILEGQTKRWILAWRFIECATLD